MSGTPHLGQVSGRQIFDSRTVGVSVCLQLLLHKLFWDGLQYISWIVF